MFYYITPASKSEEIKTKKSAQNRFYKPQL